MFLTLNFPLRPFKILIAAGFQGFKTAQDFRLFVCGDFAGVDQFGEPGNELFGERKRGVDDGEEGGGIHGLGVGVWGWLKYFTASTMAARSTARERVREERVSGLGRAV